jgi:Baseplate J-like protein
VVTTLASLLTPRTRVQWREILLTELTAAGFSVALAPSGDNRRNVVEMFAAGCAKVDETVSLIAAGGLLDYAKKGWLTLRAKSGYTVEAKAATTTYGTVRLTCASTAGPYNIASGTVWVGRASTGSVPARRYQNTSGGLLTAGGYLDVSVRAEFPGSAYNAGNGTLTTLFTSLPGVSVSNPAVGVTGTWITTLGTDDEAEAALVQRCRDKWGTLGRGANEAAYRHIATTASAEVGRVRLYAGPGDCTLEMILAGATGTISSGALSTVQSAVAAVQPTTDLPTIRAASLITITPTGTVYVRAASLATAQAAVETARVAYLADLDIGAGLDLGAVYAILRQPGVTDVDLTTPTGDVAIGYDAVLGLDLSSLVWVSV